MKKLDPNHFGIRLCLRPIILETLALSEWFGIKLFCNRNDIMNTLISVVLLLLSALLIIKV